MKRFLIFFIAINVLFGAEISEVEISKADMDILLKKCEAKDGESCYKIAYHYADGDSPRFFKSDNAKKEAYLAKGCDYGFAQSCYILALINYDNFYKSQGIKQNEAKLKSKKLLKKACDLGHSRACDEKWDLSNK
ncbi:hypothetical protein [Helicobacter sp. 23-1045]